LFELISLFSEYRYFIWGNRVLLYMKTWLNSFSRFSIKVRRKLKAKNKKIRIRIIERP
jgi:hypothetical protein